MTKNISSLNLVLPKGTWTCDDLWIFKKQILPLYKKSDEFRKSIDSILNVVNWKSNDSLTIEEIVSISNWEGWDLSIEKIKSLNRFFANETNLIVSQKWLTPPEVIPLGDGMENCDSLEMAGNKENWEVASNLIQEFLSDLRSKALSLLDENQKDLTREYDSWEKDPMTLYTRDMSNLETYTSEEIISLFKELQPHKKLVWIKRFGKTYRFEDLQKCEQDSWKWENEEWKMLYLQKNKKAVGKEKWAKIYEYTSKWKEIREEIVKSHLRLVINIAQRLQWRGLELMDLISEWNQALLRAIDLFDHTIGNKFSTYSYDCISKVIIRATENKWKGIRESNDFLEKKRIFFKFRKKFLKKKLREPTVEEIAESLGMKESKVISILDSMKEVVSLSRPVWENWAEFVDFVKDESLEWPEDWFSRMQLEQKLKQKLEEVLCELTDRERKIIRLRFWIWEDHEYTLEEIWKKFNLTRQRIQQIEVEVFKKLKHPSRREKLEWLL